MNRPLDDMPERAIVRRAERARAEVTEERARTRPPPPDDGPSEEDIERFSDVTVQCPGCGTQVLDEAEVCWKCGRAIHDRERFRGAPVWVAVMAIVLVLVAVGWLIRPLF